MVHRGIKCFAEYIKKFGKEVIDERLHINSKSYDDAIASLKNIMKKNRHIQAMEFNIDEYVDTYLEDHPYDGDEFSPFYMIGELPVIIPYAYRKLNIDDNDKYIREYFIRVTDIHSIRDEEDLFNVYQSIKEITVYHAGNVVKNRMYKMHDFLTSFDYLKPAAYTFVEFILQYFKYVYEMPLKDIEYSLNDILTSDVLVDKDLDGNQTERENNRLYLYLLCIEGYLSFFNLDKFPENDSIDLFIYKAKESFVVYMNLYKTLIKYSNKIDLSDDMYQALSDKIMNFTLFYLMPDKYLEENLRDEKSAKELLKIL